MKKTKLLFFILGILVGLGVLVGVNHKNSKNRLIPTIELPLSAMTVPNNYEECITTPNSSYNKITCDIFYGGTGKTAQSCLAKGGSNPIHADGPEGCHISFINLSLTFPKNYNECVLLSEGGGPYPQSSILKTDEYCDFILINHETPQEKEVQLLLKNCPSDYTKDNYSCEKVFYNN